MEVSRGREFVKSENKTNIYLFSSRKRQKLKLGLIFLVGGISLKRLWREMSKFSLASERCPHGADSHGFPDVCKTLFQETHQGS